MLVVVAFLGSVTLTIGAAFSAALAFGATALIVPGTGTHNVLTNTPYRDNAADRYINPSGVPCSSTDGCDIEGVDYPATFFPFVIFNGWCPGLSCDTWNDSVNTGVTNLDGALEPFKDPENEEDVIIFGYSQGGAVVSREMYNLAGLEDKSHISVVTIGNINNPLGLFSRLGFLPTIPGLNITFGPQLPTDIGIKSTNYSFEYDPVGDAPAFWGNPFTMLNAVAAFQYVHGYYLVPNDNGPTDVLPYGYTYAPDGGTLGAAIDAAPKRVHGDATFVLIPQQGALPLFQPFLDLADQTGTTSVVKPLVALFNPVTKLLVNLGYDRAADPGVPQSLSILPFNPFTFNPVTFSVQFVQALVQGVQDALNGGASLDPADSQAPETMSALRSFSRLASDPSPTPVAEKPGNHEDVVTTLAVDKAGDGTPTVTTPDTDQDKAAKEAAEAAAKEAADKAAAEAAAKEAADKAAKEAADKAAADAAAAAERAKKDADEKAAKDAADAAEKATREAEQKAAKEAADAAEKATKDAADKAREQAAEHAKEAAGGDKTAGAADGTGTTAAPADGETGDKTAA